MEETAMGKEPIAIIGMSCRLPKCDTLEEFWTILETGEETSTFPPEHRWLQRDYSRVIPEDCRKTCAGFISQNVDEFDANFFGTNPKDAVFTDPQHRIMFELVWEGLEDAGIDPTSLRDTDASVFTGTWTTDYKDILLYAGYEDWYRRYMGNSTGASAAKISYFLGTKGPSISTESGCSSVMVAVHLACQSLRNGETGLGIVTGMNLLLYPFYTGSTMSTVLAPDGKCKPFDAACDGFGRAEGGGCLVLKRLSEAVRNGDRIWAVIRGSGTCQEGTSSSMGTPTVESEARAMELALKDAQILPSEVSFVEGHVTGTVVGDPIEVAAISKVYSGERKTPLIISSVKGNVGHTESSSGITSIIKVALAINHGIIPRQVNFTALNPHINLETIPAEIPVENKEWRKNGNKKRIAGVSSFGITGTDVHVIMEEPPIKDISVNKVERSMHILKVSAKSEGTLNILLERIKLKLETGNEDFSNIAYTSNTGRANFKFRAAIVSNSNEKAAALINQNRIIKGEIHDSNDNKICFLFTGQGSQYPNMGKKLYETSPVFKSHFDKCADFLKQNYQLDIKKEIWLSSESSHINNTMISQTGIFCVEYALMKLWESWGIHAQYVLGHSLGEFCAAVCSHILSLEEALALVAERSRLIDQLPRGKMLVIKSSKDVVDVALKEFRENNECMEDLDYAAFNSNDQTVIAGDTDTIEAFSQYLNGKGVKSSILSATHAFHSKHMDPILYKYEEIAKRVSNLEQPEAACKFISGLNGKLMTAEAIDSTYWVEHTRKPVAFIEACNVAIQEGCRIFVEIGPQPVLSSLMMANSEKVEDMLCLPSLRRSTEEWTTLLNSLGSLYVKGFNVDWKEFDEPYERSRVCLPHYPFIGKRYWPDSGVKMANSLHPLLGTLVDTPTPTKLFESSLSLSSFEYVKDHIVGELVIFPGAGFLEMALAAGLATLSGSHFNLSQSKHPMIIKNLNIEAPLSMVESFPSNLLTAVDFSNQDNLTDIPIKIYKKIEMESSSSFSKWITHASASFSTNLSPDDKRFTSTIDMSLLDDLDGDEELILKIYEKLAHVGLNFGPNFKSLRKSWKITNEEKSIFKVDFPKDHGANSSYIIHPVVLDAMMQAILFAFVEQEWTSDNLHKNKMYLPIKIGRLVYLPKTNDSKSSKDSQMFVHVISSTLPDKKNSEIGVDLMMETIAILTDSKGVVRCFMTAVEIAETTPRAFELALRKQKSNLPNLWEQSWQRRLGPSQLRVDVELLLVNEDNASLELECPKRKDYMPEAEHYLREFAYLNIINALYDCGWSPKVGASFEIEEMMLQLNIHSLHAKYFKFILETLEEEGIFRRDSELNSIWKILQMPPTQKQIRNRLACLATKYKSSTMLPEITAIIKKIGDKLASLLQGKESPLGVLFPEDEEAPSAMKYYDELSNFYNLFDTVKILFSEIFKNLKRSKGKYVLRLLEVGAGTGGLSSNVLQILEDYKISYEYTFTDISPAFFTGAEKKLEKYKKNLIFKKLDIEEDPMSQGFQPTYYDIVMTFDVIHATKYVARSFENIRHLLKPSGTLIFLDMIKKRRDITYLWGLFTGFWHFQDFELRQDHCVLPLEKWKEVISASGFEVDLECATMDIHHAMLSSHKIEEFQGAKRQCVKKFWLLIQSLNTSLSKYLINKLKGIDRKVVILEKEDFSEGYLNELQRLRQNWENDELEGILYCLPLNENKKSQEEILRPLFEVTKLLPDMVSKSQKKLPRLVVLTKESMHVEEMDHMSGFHASTISGFCTAIRNEIQDLPCRNIEMDSTCLEVEGPFWEQIFFELFNDDKEAFVVFRGANKFVPKVKPLRATKDLEDLEIPGNRFQLVLPESKMIHDLEFTYLDEYSLGEQDVEVEVKVSALNFRDVFAVLKPSAEFDKLNEIGIDFSGVVKNVGGKVTMWKVGDLVCGVNTEGGALPSHVKLREDMLIKIPENTNLWEAATIPAVFSTVYVSLIEKARMQPNDTVLIHTGTGGVGLMAIDICKREGVSNIIATAGNTVKRRFLREVLGLKHVFNSRDISYQEGILEVTEGKGVDIVLNTLTGEGFKEATLKTCAPGARFIEISKLNIFKKEEIIDLGRADVEYHVVDLSAFDMKDVKDNIAKVGKDFNEGNVKPLPYTTFSAVNIRQALDYLQRAKHIGKVLVTMPHFNYGEGKLTVETPLFSERSTYLVTGGLGGIGFAVSKWLLNKGAKNIILASRSLPSSNMETEIKKVNEKKGANLVPVQLDVGDVEACKEFFQRKLKSLDLPPLKGIMHAAGILADGIIANLSWEKLSSPFRSKVHGTLNLHEFTKSLNLDFFVMFSSIASVLGSPGQANHSAGNQFEDSFAHYRRSIGLPACTINWGPFGEVGIAKDVDLPGIRSFSTEEGLMALEYILKTHRSQTIVLSVKSFHLLASYLATIPTLVEKSTWDQFSESGDTSVKGYIKSEQFWTEYNSKKSREEKLEYLKVQLKTVLRYMLHLSETDELGDDMDLRELGVDSLMFIEIKNGIQALLGDKVKLSANELKDCKTINMICEAIITAIEGKPEEKCEFDKIDIL